MNYHEGKKRAMFKRIPCIHLIIRLSVKNIAISKGNAVNFTMPMKITNLGKLPIEQKGKLPSDENKIKITKESSQVKKENSQSLKIIKIKSTKE